MRRRMIHSGMKIVFVFVCLILVSGCSKPAATVNGKKIDMKTFEMYLQERVQSHKAQSVSPDMQKLESAVIQELISEAIILEDAKERGIQVSEEEVEKEITGLKQRIGQEAFLKSLQDKGVSVADYRIRLRDKLVMVKYKNSLVSEDSVTEEERKAYYENSPVPFLKPSRVYMKMIEFQSEDTASEVIEEMDMKKVDFDDIADRLAAENRAIVSDYGWVRPEFFSPAIVKAIRDLEINEYGGPYKGKKSFFLIKIKDREEEGISSYEEVRDDITKIVLEQRRQEALSHVLEEKKKTARIKILI